MSGNAPSDIDDMRQALEWQRAAGADLAVSETPIDRFATAPRPGAPPKTRAATNPSSGVQPPAAPTASPPPLGPEPVAEAEKIASAAKTLEELERAYAAFDGCPLKLRATQLVFADGNPQADLMLIGEAPGREEDLQGKPFVGRAGQLLDRMLAAIGLDRQAVYIANTVPWRPPGNRNPTPAEIAACLPFLHRQIALVDPQFIVTIGAPATQTLFETTKSISRMRGQVRELTAGGKSRQGLAMLHPAYLLRQPAQKHLAWQDLLTLKKALAGEMGES